MQQDRAVKKETASVLEQFTLLMCSGVKKKTTKTLFLKAEAL